MLQLVEHWPALKSILVSLVARCLSLKQKSRSISQGAIAPVVEATLGVVADHTEFPMLVRQLILPLVRTLSLAKLTLVWLNAPGGSLVPIVNERLAIVAECDAPLDCILDASHLARAQSVAEMQHAMGAWVRRGSHVPIVQLGLRWERILAWVNEAPKSSESRYRVLVESLGHVARVCPHGVAWSVEVPKVAAALFETWHSPEEVAVQGTLSLGDKSGDIQVYTVPKSLTALVAQQANIGLVFDTALDVVAQRMSERKRTNPIADKDTKTLACWNSTLDALGCVSLNVWVHDVDQDSLGVWRAALDAWTVGNMAWPV